MRACAASLVAVLVLMPNSEATALRAPRGSALAGLFILCASLVTAAALLRGVKSFCLPIAAVLLVAAAAASLWLRDPNKRVFEFFAGFAKNLGISGPGFRKSQLQTVITSRDHDRFS